MISSAARALAQLLDAFPPEAPCRITIEPGTGPYTMGEVRQALTAQHPRAITTGQAAEIFGWSSDTWAKWAKEGLIDGAVREGGEGGWWRLPFLACENQYRARMSRAPVGGKRRRGKPWPKRKKASNDDTPAPAPRRPLGIVE